MEISLREVTDDDIELVMAWRSDPVVYRGLLARTKRLKWEEHLNWWNNHYKNGIEQYMIEVCENGVKRRIGVVRVTKHETDDVEIGYMVGEVTAWGKGIGKEAVRLVCDKLRGRGYDKVYANIAIGNKRSINLVKSLGFKEVGKSKRGERIFDLELMPEIGGTGSGPVL